MAREALARFGDRVELVHGDYRDARARCSTRAASRGVDGVLADLGVSSMQLDAPGRGFSFRRDEPLDMRMDTSSGPDGRRGDRRRRRADAGRRDLRVRRGAARAAHRARDRRGAARRRRSRRPGQLADVVRRAMPRKGYSRIDPATRTFQAIRIWVNRELEGLDAFLARAARAARVRAGGWSVITFHSLEDRIVKHTLRALQADGTRAHGAHEAADGADRGGDRTQPAGAQRQAAGGANGRGQARLGP